MDLSIFNIVLPIITIIILVRFFIYYYSISQPLADTTEWIQFLGKKSSNLVLKYYPLNKGDILPIIILTVIYGIVAFWGLGDTEAPESFFRFTNTENSVTISLNEESEIGAIMYYTGLESGYYTLEFSSDGVNWTEQQPAEGSEYAMEQSYAHLFVWQYATVSENAPISYIRITANTPFLQLGELALYDVSGELISTDRFSISSDAARVLFDEQDIIPASPSYLNSAYFDEIYHGRAAYEMLGGIFPYEATHPPLGKIIISIGVAIFGMVPFGWRFMGTLFGILMIPIMYTFIKNMFGKKAVAVCGTLLFAFDFMHYVQTRIATIDTYAVFFILLMYYFMYRYISIDYKSSFKKSVMPLFLSGLFFGIGVACKWPCMYAGTGLALIYTIHLINKGIYFCRNVSSKQFARDLIKTLLLSIVFFIIIPLIIYCLSYIPYGYSRCMTLQGGMLFKAYFYEIILNNQIYMYNYHSTLVSTHPYSSTWYEWIVNARPILYYLDITMGNGLKSAFAAFGNPIVWWGGIGAFLAMVYRSIKHHEANALFIIIGYLAQLLPWVFVTRITFAYHYFPSTIFLILAFSHVFNTIFERGRGKYKFAVFGLTAVSIIMFIAFYPVLSGIAVPEAYTSDFLRWVTGRWPF